MTDRPMREDLEEGKGSAKMLESGIRTVQITSSMALLLNSAKASKE